MMLHPAPTSLEGAKIVWNRTQLKCLTQQCDRDMETVWSNHFKHTHTVCARVCLSLSTVVFITVSSIQQIVSPSVLTHIIDCAVSCEKLNSQQHYTLHPYWQGPHRDVHQHTDRTKSQSQIQQTHIWSHMVPRGWILLITMILRGTRHWPSTWRGSYTVVEHLDLDLKRGNNVKWILKNKMHTRCWVQW